MTDSLRSSKLKWTIQNTTSKACDLTSKKSRTSMGSSRTSKTSSSVVESVRLLSVRKVVSRGNHLSGTTPTDLN